ncbi:MAG: DUF3417 domain-containing protein, partial [Bacteroidales bacterium]|nr:DUF3417 domain-containing protein [Bacteroidales bacterium]
PLKRIFGDQDLQDKVDAETIYNMFESEIIPAYYNNDEKGVPLEWISYIKNSMVKVSPEFTMKRMMDDYFSRFYNKLWKRSLQLKENDYRKAIDIAAWKDWMKERWDKLEVLTHSFEKPENNSYQAGKTYNGEVLLNIHDIPAENVGVEYIITTQGEAGKHKFVASDELNLVSSKDGKALYALDMTPEKAGSYYYGLRIYPKSPDLPHKQDFYLLKWID